MSAISDILDGLQTLVEPAAPTDAVTIVIPGSGGAVIAIRFFDDTRMEIWSRDVLQFTGLYNTSQTTDERIQWFYGHAGFSFQKTPVNKWSATHLSITGRGDTPEEALLALYE